MVEHPRELSRTLVGLLKLVRKYVPIVHTEHPSEINPINIVYRVSYAEHVSNYELLRLTKTIKKARPSIFKNSKFFFKSDYDHYNHFFNPSNTSWWKKNQEKNTSSFLTHLIKNQ